MGSLSVKPALAAQISASQGAEDLRVSVNVECFNTTGIRVEEYPFLIEGAFFPKYDSVF